MDADGDAVAPEAFSEAGDIDFDHLFVCFATGAVDLVQERGFGHGAPAGFGQGGEDGEFAPGDVDGRVAVKDLERLQIEGEAADIEAAAGGGGAAPTEGADAGGQLIHSEGFGQVIIGARIKTGDAVFGAGARSQEDHRAGIAARAHSPEDLDAAFAGEVDVKDDDIGAFLGQEQEGLVAVFQKIYRVAVILQTISNPLGEAAIIFDHHDPHRSLFHKNESLVQALGSRKVVEGRGIGSV